MEWVQKLALMAPEGTRFEEEAYHQGPSPSLALVKELASSITSVSVPGRGRMNVLKAMMTSICSRNCNYCGFRAGRDCERASFTPQEMADGFFRLYRANLVEGLFLSSGIKGTGARAQDEIIATADILRHRLGYRDYLHLKIMPGAEKEQVQRTMELANRVSINLEAPTPKHLQPIAPRKEHSQLEQPLEWMAKIREDKGWRVPSLATQFVVGPGGESDQDLLVSAQRLHTELGLRRVFFSPFNPIKDTPLENETPTPPIRQHRLYQGAYLLRDYNFEVKELPFSKQGFLPDRLDPKLAWANQYLSYDPVEVNRESRWRLLRVPGIGPVGAERILRERRRGTLQSLEDLRKIGVHVSRAAPYITMDGNRPPFQLPLGIPDAEEDSHSDHEDR
ncbi:MAG: radical SAM protein [Chloroflexota bacterium]